MIFTFQDGSDVVTVTGNGIRQHVMGLDDVYRKFDIDNRQFPEMLRGHWEPPNTLLVEDLQLGKINKVIFRIQFSGKTINVAGEEVYSKNQFSFQGEVNR